jgi:transglutaminase-like putative cysteine protease/predicted glutamine amidotransferase
MTQLLALSVEYAISPSFRLQALNAEESTNMDHPFGWGVAWYPSGGKAAMLVKDPTSVGKNALTNVLSDWERFASTVFVAHLRGAAKRTQIQDTHPFSRSYAGRDWVLAHNGDLRHGFREVLELGSQAIYEPIGVTDSEHLFCWLMEQIRASGYRTLATIPRDAWSRWLGTINALGTLNLILTDGTDVLSYSDAFGYRPLWYIRRAPPNPMLKYVGPEVEIVLGSAQDINRTSMVISSSRLSDDGWSQLRPGWALVSRRGSSMWCAQVVAATGESKPATQEPAARASEGAPAVPRIAGATRGITHPEAQRAAEAAVIEALEIAPTPPVREPNPAARPAQSATALEQAELVAAERALNDAAVRLAAPEVASRALDRETGDDFGESEPQEKILETIHETIYTYKQPVTVSEHLLRLRPVIDEYQQLLEYEVFIEPRGARSRSFTDVFGNHVVELSVREPYTEWRVRARSVVRLTMGARPRLRSVYERQRLPLVWMPWQRQMMNPYLLPPELPESQLRELSEYAMSFAERQDNDLVETLKDINRSIHRDYIYEANSTTLATTPFDVYVGRKGVCQDFANLFIALCRLLDIPARYRVGYIFTGGRYGNERQGDESHAWVEVYIPLIGWRGFDPTNGTLVGDDHVRVACGRNYRDATPTSGTLYAGGTGEKLQVTVRMFDRSPGVVAGATAPK